MRHSIRYVAALVVASFTAAAFLTLSCGHDRGSSAPTGGGDGASTLAPVFGTDFALWQWQVGGVSTPVLQIDVPLTREEPSVTFLNVMVDLDGNGVLDGQAEWVFQNVPVPTEDVTYTMPFQVPASGPAPGTAVLVEAALTVDPIDASNPWNGAVPSDGTSTTANPTMTALDATPAAEFSDGGDVAGMGGTGSPDPAPTSDGLQLLDVPPGWDGGKYRANHLRTDAGKPPTTKQGKYDCVPHSIQTGVTWLARAYGFATTIAPEGGPAVSLKPGASATDVNGMVGAVSDTLGKLPISITPPPSGGQTMAYDPLHGGTDPDEFLNGKNAFCAQYNLPIDTTRTPPGATDYSGQGAFAAIVQAIDEGCIVELTVQVVGKYGTKPVYGKHAIVATGYKVATAGGGTTTLTVRDSNSPSAATTQPDTSGDNPYTVTFDGAGAAHLNGPNGGSFYFGKETGAEAVILAAFVECYRPPDGGSYTGGPRAPTFASGPIQAAFNQATFSTNYVAAITNPSSEPLTVTWSGPNCGTYTPMGAAAPDGANAQSPSMTWTHPHPPCALTTNHSDVTVQLTIVGTSGGLSCIYQGSASGTGPRCTLMP